jgi:hypothetical protein
LGSATALLSQTKNGEPIVVHLPPPAVAALANLDKNKRRVFGLTKCARLYALLNKAEKLSGVTLPADAASFPRRVEASIRQRRHHRPRRIGLMEVLQRRQRLLTLGAVG